MHHVFLTMISMLALSASAAQAGVFVPLPGAGVAGPIALVAVCAAIAGLKYARGRRSK